MHNQFVISVVIPCYFNEQNIPVTFDKLLKNETLFGEGVCFEYVFVDDGSKDGTFAELKRIKNQFPEKVKIIKLVKNVGSYVAIKAGLAKATGDCMIVTSADLQDPPELIHKMYSHWKNGVKLVIANRIKRNDAWLSDLFSGFYHRLIKKFALGNIPDGGYDFVLFDRKLRDELLNIKERNTNTLYLLSWLGYDFVTIPYERRAREIGKSRWTLAKKVKLFVDSFVSFSFYPIRLISITGVLLACLALMYAAYLIAAKLLGYIQVEGWTTTNLLILIIGAFQMLGIGILGEYLWRAFDESRYRQEYIIDEYLD